jgi:hypothetical protein
MLPRLVKIIGFIMAALSRINLLITFIALIPLTLYILYNVYDFNSVKALVGCVVIVTMIYINKAIQGGN